MSSRLRLQTAVTVAVFATVSIVEAQTSSIPRTPSGQPDLSGTYDIATLTPLQRPERFGNKAFLTEEEAQPKEDFFWPN